MFDSLIALKNGTKKQRQAFHAIQELNLLNDFTQYNPVVCGTIPLQIDIDSSDLDVILNVHDFDYFERKALNLYRDLSEFRIKRTMIKNQPVIKINFHYHEFEFELFGQNQPTHNQHAYLHMIIQAAILNERPKLKDEVIILKQQGYKTEPAFCSVLNIEGDSYIGLLRYGREQGYIK
ncbi:DUF4269 domain-containing protein [Alkalibacillus silvisoli]|uniref:DUF4269 domain-containing protein n=1 Tax=Alkalibacillus silvisoli TaxID=392823 RepID=A0ABP3JFP2_9BACI